MASGPCTRVAEEVEAREIAWGEGDIRKPRKEMKEPRRPGGIPSIPWAKLAPMSAPGPSGDRQEHSDDIMKGAGASQRRRLTRVLDELTVRWAINRLPTACRWLLNTQVLFLNKDKESTSKDDEE